MNKNKKIPLLSIILFISNLFANNVMAEIITCTKDGDILKNKDIKVLKETLNIKPQQYPLLYRITYLLKNISDDATLVTLGVIFEKERTPSDFESKDGNISLKKIEKEDKTLYVFQVLFKKDEEKKLEFAYEIPFSPMVYRSKGAVADLSISEPPIAGVEGLSMNDLYGSFQGCMGLWLEYNFTNGDNWANEKEKIQVEISVPLGGILDDLLDIFELWCPDEHVIDYRGISLPSDNPYIWWRSDWPLEINDKNVLFIGECPDNSVFKIYFYRTVFPTKREDVRPFLAGQLSVQRRHILAVLKVYKRQVVSSIKHNNLEHVDEDKKEIERLKKLVAYFPEMEKDYVDIILEFYGQKTNNNNIQSFLQRQRWFLDRNKVNKPKASKELIDYLLKESEELTEVP